MLGMAHSYYNIRIVVKEVGTIDCYNKTCLEITITINKAYKKKEILT